MDLPVLIPVLLVNTAFKDSELKLVDLGLGCCWT